MNETEPNGGAVVSFRRDPTKPTVEGMENLQRNVDYWGDRCCKAEAKIARLRAALMSVRQYLEDLGDYPEPGETIREIDAALAATNKRLAQGGAE